MVMLCVRNLNCEAEIYILYWELSTKVYSWLLSMMKVGEVYKLINTDAGHYASEEHPR